MAASPQREPARIHLCPVTGRSVYRPYTYLLRTRDGLVKRWSCELCGTTHDTAGVIARRPSLDSKDKAL